MFGFQRSMSSNNLAPAQPPTQAPVVSGQIPADLMMMAESLGMSVWKINGQRRYRSLMINPQFNFKPVQGTEIFIAKYPRTCTEADILPLCSLVAPVYEFRMMLDFSGTNRGFGFVRYFTPEDAELARQVLHNYEIQKGKWIVAVKSVDNCRLHISDLPVEKSWSEIEAEIRSVAEGVVGVEFFESCAVVDFDSHRLASVARRNFIGGLVGLWGQYFVVDWAPVH